MRSLLSGIFLVFATAFSSSAAVMYSFSQQPVNAPGSYPSPAFSFDFTVPVLLTSPTTIPGSSINSPGFHYLGLDFSIMSVEIDPGLNSAAPIIGNGIPFIGLQTGFGGQVVMTEGACFVPDAYGCQASPGSPLFDHFGTYRDGDITLTISSTDAPIVPTPKLPDVPQAAVPEPRFEAAAGLLALLSMFGIARRARRIAAA